MKRLILLCAVLLTPLVAFAADYGARSDIDPDPNYSRTLSLGTKGYANYSTANRSLVKFKAATATGTAVTVQVFFNGSESQVYPSSGEAVGVKKVSQIGFRAYSAQAPTTVHVWGQ